jgi:hypothetical protein
MFQKCLNKHLNKLTHWKNKSRIYGEACELWVEENLKCPNCASTLQKCSTNKKSVDHICSGCGEEYQVKASSKSHQAKSGHFTITGAAYQPTVETASNWNIILLEYGEEKDIEDLIAELPDVFPGITINKEEKERCERQYYERHNENSNGLTGYIKKVHYIDKRNISKENVIPRKPLSTNARRAGWQGCYLKFDLESVRELQE